MAHGAVRSDELLTSTAAWFTWAWPVCRGRASTTFDRWHQGCIRGVTQLVSPTLYHSRMSLEHDADPLAFKVTGASPQVLLHFGSSGSPRLDRAQFATFLGALCQELGCSFHEAADLLLVLAAVPPEPQDHMAALVSPP